MFELFARFIHPFLANNPKTMNDHSRGTLNYRLTMVSEYHVVIVLVYALMGRNNTGNLLELCLYQAVAP